MKNLDKLSMQAACYWAVVACISLLCCSLVFIPDSFSNTLLAISLLGFILTVFHFAGALVLHSVGLIVRKKGGNHDTKK